MFKASFVLFLHVLVINSVLVLVFLVFLFLFLFLCPCSFSCSLFLVRVPLVFLVPPPSLLLLSHPGTRGHRRHRLNNRKAGLSEKDYTP